MKIKIIFIEGLLVHSTLLLSSETYQEQSSRNIEDLEVNIHIQKIVAYGRYQQKLGIFTLYICQNHLQSGRLRFIFVYGNRTIGFALCN